MTADTPKTPQAAPFDWAALSDHDLALRFDNSAAWLLRGEAFDGPHIGAGAYLEAATRLRRGAAAPAEPAQERAAPGLTDAVINAARRAMDASWESQSFESICLASHDAAALSLALDEYDAALSARAATQELAAPVEPASAAIDMMHRMLEAPGTHVRESWKEAIRPVLAGLLTATDAVAPPVEPAPSEPDDTKKWLEAHSDATRRMKAALRDPVTVHAALLRGEIAKPDIRDMLHVYGAEALERWDRSEPARDEAMERDAARYRWLRHGKARSTGSPKSGRLEVFLWDNRSEAHVLKGEELDTAIDAALAQAQPEQHKVLVEMPDGSLQRKAVSDLKGDDMVVFDGPDAFASSEAWADKLGAEIDAAGGIEAWRAKCRPRPEPVVKQPLTTQPDPKGEA